MAEVGDTWEYVAPDGIGIVSRAVARVHLTRKDDDGFEMWVYEFLYTDGSGHVSDWAPTFRKASELVKVNFTGKCKPVLRKRKAPQEA